MRKYLAIPLGVAVALGIAGTAHAHTPTHAVSCEALTASGKSYTRGGTVTLTYGTAHFHDTFTGPTFTYTLANPDRTRPESWSIVITSGATDGSATYTGTEPACETTTTVTGSTTPAATSTTNPPPPPSTSSLPPSTTTPASTTSTTASTVPGSTSSTSTAPAATSTTSSPKLSASSPTTPTTPPPATATSTTTTSPTRSGVSPTTTLLPATGADTGRTLALGAAIGTLGIALVIGTTRTRRWGVKR